MTQAFTGIKILDFSQVLAGPVAVMQLALLGAEVIKIEQPDVGDQMRRLNEHRTRCQHVAIFPGNECQ